MNERYRWRGGSEFLLRHSAGAPVTLLVIPALFEEANRMRRFTVSVMRQLAVSGIGTILPDLPGTGESSTALADVMLQDWHDTITALAPSVSGSIAIRGGALLDAPIKNCWRLAPDAGERLLRDMARATSFSTGISPTEIDAKARQQPTRIAGNFFTPTLYSAVHAAVPIGQAHVTAVEGAKLWRAAEPGDDPEFAKRIADDIVSWAATCVAS
jgi:hypothetical protein